MRNEQYKDYETLRLTKEIWTSISIKENRTLDEKKRSRPRNNLKRIRIKVIISNTYEI